MTTSKYEMLNAAMELDKKKKLYIYTSSSRITNRRNSLLLCHANDYKNKWNQDLGIICMTRMPIFRQ